MRKLFRSMWISCFSLNFYPLVLASIDNSCLNYYNICQMVFFFPKFIYCLVLSTVLKSFCFLTFIFLLIYLYPCVLMYSHFTQWVTLTEIFSGLYIGSVVYNPVISMVKLSQLWPVGVPYTWLLCSFDKSPWYFL